MGQPGPRAPGWVENGSSGAAGAGFQPGLLLPTGDAARGRQPQLHPQPPLSPAVGTSLGEWAGGCSHPASICQARGRDKAAANPVPAAPVIPLANGSEPGMPPSSSRSPARGWRALLWAGSALRFASLTWETQRDAPRQT